MSLPDRLPASSHMVHLCITRSQEMEVMQRVLAEGLVTGTAVIQLVDPLAASFVGTAAAYLGVQEQQLTVIPSHDVTSDGCASVVPRIEEALTGIVHKPPPMGPNRRPTVPPVVHVQLGPLFAACDSARQMLQLVLALDRLCKERQLCILESLPAAALPKSMPTEFFGVHSHWSVAADGSGSPGNGIALEDRAFEIAIQHSHFRRMFLELARESSASAIALHPDPLNDLRHGVLILDDQLDIRYCSPRGADLLGRSISDLVGRSIQLAIDGVDLVTLKHEVGKTQPGSRQDPFVVTWRLGPGVYEPRKVTIDALTSGKRLVGFLFTIGVVENVRGPRSVYRQLTQDREAGAASDDGVCVEAAGDDDQLAESLQGTQITRREHEILLFALDGMSNRDIARHVSIAEVTVKKHLTSIYRKLRINSRSELMQSFASVGVLEHEA